MLRHRGAEGYAERKADWEGDAENERQDRRQEKVVAGITDQAHERFSGVTAKPSNVTSTP